jgi:hypothetical protein
LFAPDWAEFHAAVIKCYQQRSNCLILATRGFLKPDCGFDAACFAAGHLDRPI